MDERLEPAEEPPAFRPQPDGPMAPVWQALGQQPRDALISQARAVLQQHRNDAGLAREATFLGYQLKHFPEMMAFAQHWVSLDGESGEAWYMLAIAQITLQHTPLAIQALKEAAERDHRPVQVAVQMGHCHMRLQYIDLAEMWFRRAVSLAPDDPETNYGLGHLLSQSGDADEAARYLEKALAARTNHAAALADLVALPTPLSPERQAQAEAVANNPKTHPDFAGHLLKALGRRLERAKEYDRAFALFQRGNALLRNTQPYDPAVQSAWITEMETTLTAPVLTRVAAHGHPSRRPIFIFGMPRSGTTLVEQILASHPDVAPAGELQNMQVLARSLPPKENKSLAQFVATLTPETQAAAAERYLERLSQVDADSPRVTDKLPFNFMYLGLIATLFPNAALIECRREPRDVCVSCYGETFAKRLSFGTDLWELGTFFRNFDRLMRHWHTALPGRIHRVTYEELTADQETHTCRLLAACGLDWDPACLQPERLQRAVTTPSAWQVRKPVNRGSVARWKRFEKYLAPLEAGLAGQPRPEDSSPPS